ncbi:MAG: GDP-L-fucose synthase [Desulfobacterales bacterium]|nr:GDP-L-fucose synthase [Desulfobacterales bacterium]
MKHEAKLYLAGHTGLVGSALFRKLNSSGYSHVITSSHHELDLTDQKAVADFFSKHKPEYVFLAAARVGGIHANSHFPGEFIYQNLMIQTNVIHQSYLHQVKRLLFLGSSCIYPGQCPQPMKENDFMTGVLEPTNEPYAIAKISGVEMCWAYNRQYNTCFIPVMPTNLYGINDNFNLSTSHVVPALLRKFHEAVQSRAEKVSLWGTGIAKREFLYVDDLADACVFLMNESVEKIKTIAGETNRLLLNIGTGKEITIQALAELIGEITGFSGIIQYDSTKPDGTLLKRLDIFRMKQLDWEAQTKLKDGLIKTYQWYKDTIHE